MGQLLQCHVCKEWFEDSPYPASTHPDSSPVCSDCIELMLDSVDARPMSSEEVNRIMAKVRIDNQEDPEEEA